MNSCRCWCPSWQASSTGSSFLRPVVGGGGKPDHDNISLLPPRTSTNENANTGGTALSLSERMTQASAVLQSQIKLLKELGRLDLLMDSDTKQHNYLL
jgi:hypothetical protein